MNGFLSEVAELVREGDGDRMIEIAVSDLYQILNRIHYLEDTVRRQGKAGLSMSRAIDNLLGRASTLEEHVDQLSREVRDLT